METISFRFFPGESNYRSDQTSEGYRNGCDCRQASGHANGSLVAPLRTRSTPMKRARTERSLTNDRSLSFSLFLSHYDHRNRRGGIKVKESTFSLPEDKYHFVSRFHSGTFLRFASIR